MESVELESGQSPSDRFDVGCRVYHMKYTKLVSDIRSGHVFGAVSVGVFCVNVYHFFVI